MAITRRALLAGAGASTFASKTHAAAPRWTDVHMHLIGGRERRFEDAAEAAIAAMDEAGIARAVVFPPPFPRPGIFDYPDYTPELKRYPGRFAFLGGGGTLNPAIHNAGPLSGDAPPEMKQAFKDQANRILDAGAAGFGEIAVLHLALVANHPFEQVVPDHPLLLALAEVAGERKAVIDLHLDPVVQAPHMTTPSSLKVPPNPSALENNLAGFERLLAHHRNARIVWAHGGSDFTGNMTPALVRRLMKTHPSCFMSLRPVPLMAARNNPFGLRFYNLILTPQGIDPAWLALFRDFPDRFVLGGDTFFLGPSVDQQSVLHALGRGNAPRLAAARVLLERLPGALATRIAVTNAQRLYGL